MLRFLSLVLASPVHPMSLDGHEAREGGSSDWGGI